MARPRKEYGISAGGVGKNLLIVFRHRQTDKQRKIDAGTSSRAIAKKNALSLIDAYYQREAERASKDTETQPQPQPQQQQASIQPDWMMSELELHWWNSMSGTIKPTTRRHIRSAFRNWISLMGDTQIHQIDFSTVREWHTKFLHIYNDKMRLENPDWNDVKSSNGLRNYHGDLAAVWNVMLKSKIVPMNPFQGQKPKSVELDLRGRAWNVEKQQMILNAAESYAAKENGSEFAEVMPYVITLMLNTGIRPKELVNIRNSDIINHNGKSTLVIRASAAKSSKARIIPLNVAARDAIECLQIIGMERKAGYKHLEDTAKKTAIKHSHIHLSGSKSLEFMHRNHEARTEMLKGVEYGDDDYVLSVSPDKRTRQDSVGKAFAKLIKGTGIDAVLYDCRHTFACRMLDAGVSIVKLANILGHSDVTLTQRYARTDDLDVPDF